MGSLFAALVSYLDAKKNSGQWLVRIEDIDPPRELEGASDDILATLKAHGFEHDQDIRYQSTQSSLYEKHLEHLASNKHCYRCPCSRKQLSDNQGRHLMPCEKISQNPLPSKLAGQYAIRLNTSAEQQSWHDVFEGELKAIQTEDFILKRKDQLYAYQLAVVSDDIDQQVSHVIRGQDLLDSTPMQLELYSLLGHKPPIFGHFPLIRNNQGQKLSKQNLAPGLKQEQALNNLRTLGNILKLDSSALDQSPKALLDKYLEQWDHSRIEALNRDALIFAD